MDSGYVTIVLDLQSGAVLHVGQGKGGDALLAFWRRLRASGAKIEAVATDMSPAYIEAVTTYLPGATLVFDRFHVIKLYNEKLSDLRRDLHRQRADTMQKDVLKGIRWLLLKRPENLDASRREPQRLREALRLNEPLAIAYHLKDELNEIWEQDDQEAAQALLLDWIVYAFVLMSNHNQLFVETTEANPATGMQFLNGGYSDYRDVRKAWP